MKSYAVLFFVVVDEEYKQNTTRTSKLFRISFTSIYIISTYCKSQRFFFCAVNVLCLLCWIFVIHFSLHAYIELVKIMKRASVNDMEMIGFWKGVTKVRFIKYQLSIECMENRMTKKCNLFCQSAQFQRATSLKVKLKCSDEFQM